MVFLSVTGLTSRYDSSKGPVYAVDDVDFSLNDGESIGIAGESACGKSTLGLSIIRMLLGGKTQGKIVFNDESILDIDETEFNERFRWKKISMIFQGAMNSLDPVFTINEQFLEILKQHEFEGDTKQVISDAMSSVNLDENVLKKYPHELSGGMKQRVVIAMGLLLKPKFVIADEPTTALDVLIQAQIINLLKSLKKSGMSFMLITHDLAVLSEIADKIGIMYGGQMIEFGSAEELYKNPKHPYTQGLLESIPTLQGNKPKYIKGIPPSLLEAPTQCRFIDRCPLVVEKCKQLPPKFKTETGYVRCWLYEDK
ncbi:Oligopeptide transport ATP-binding protein OppD [Marine Group I thaumarchaeote SCGC AAA799-E16]|uniref:Oligopeptide transport ATP-binding protein OppD n=5 Tax=Marine Group I TaxID=905826 RepID=A0A087S5T5_9ARCH|nr:Oligopeptide transport ATP-binding protein OppD [Marine Group I thaumarchaeote SCGC AAA799-N04]KER06600.1 Oligopeptide transport ATP-binding protein OppD [Marine Group I thaumarchaeote SCGC AAA799-E16]KFM16087.1 Oligopeptide transport ATP-binding protein OppD [Marine Group I thaumarchaeote SCGC AAA799-D11]KFM17824.1 Oligopeptide transport ATP-binding protein AppD [Marine Group I thaumarchaeote SCGC RSA3]KFM21089.1 Oligopeptide transport ATP-binding protein OppD [Marine Group I thaumarchaeote